MDDERQKQFNDAMCLVCTSLRAELAATTAALEQWTDWFDCDSPHDTDANHSTVLGKEQRRANIAERQSRALAAHVEELRRALGTMINSAYPHPTEHPTMTEAWAVGRSALAATPVQSLNRVKAEALREAANRIPQTTPVGTWKQRAYWRQGREYAIEQIQGMAEALDSEPPATR